MTIHMPLCAFHKLPALAIILLTVGELTSRSGAQDDASPKIKVAASEASAESAGALLHTRSAWRCYFVFANELVRWEDGEVSPAKLAQAGKSKNLVKAGRAAPLQGPPAGWIAAEFDDSAWLATPGPLVHNGVRRDLALVCLRGRFEVADPPKAGLSLSLAYRGGAVVYLNGREIGRGSLLAGAVKPETPAEDYPKDLYLDKDGSLLSVVPGTDRNPNPNKDLLEQRKRKLTVKVPADGLQKGVNVLAIELHRAPTAELYYKTPRKERVPVDWSMLGFEGLTLAGSKSDAAPKTSGLLAWAGNPLADAFDSEPGDPCAPAVPVRIAATRNGAFDGVILLRSAEPIKGLKVTLSDLGGAGQGIPASAVQVRYATSGHPPVPDSPIRHPAGAKFLGILLEEPPKEVSLPAGAKAVTMGVWLTVCVPKSAAAGKYEGTATITVGAGSAKVPVQVTVADYALPDPRNFVTHTALVESPESVALQYGVPLWSDEHFKHLDKCFSFLGQIGNKSLYIPITGQTNFGNEFTMVRWIKQGDGSYKHDFSVVEKYLDLALKHITGQPMVCIYAWTPVMGGGSFGKTPEAGKNASPLLFTVYDPATGKMANERGPDWGTPEIQPFLKPVFDGLRKALADRKIEKFAIGITEDFTPSKQAADDLKAVSGDAPWVVHSHGKPGNFLGHPVTEGAYVWGNPMLRLSTDPMKQYGWRAAPCLTIYPRYGAGTMGMLTEQYPPGLFHAITEGAVAAGVRGMGRIALDYFPCIKGPRNQTTCVISRFPTRARPGNPMLSGGATFLSPEAGGPVASVRFETFRLGIQDTEVRTFIEQALLDKILRAKIGDDLASRTAEVLDERLLAMMTAGQHSGSSMSSMGSDVSWLWYAATWPERTARLYQLAAEVGKAIGQDGP